VKVQELVKAINGDHFLSPEIMCDKDNLEVQMLLNEADDLNTKLRIGPIAQEVNEETTRHAVNLIRDALKAGGKPLRTAQIALLGISQKTHFVETEKDLAKALAKTLEKNGAKLRFYDPNATSNEQSDFKYPLKKSLTETVEGADCIVVFANHEHFRRLNLRKLKVIAKKNPAIVDLEDILEPEKVEDEGFIYRGLGRGVWKK
jgi:UDP-N-acetyl-D-mannosaminuronate dehydrogenase